MKILEKMGTMIGMVILATGMTTAHAAEKDGKYNDLLLTCYSSDADDKQEKKPLFSLYTLYLPGPSHPLAIITFTDTKKELSGEYSFKEIQPGSRLAGYDELQVKTYKTIYQRGPENKFIATASLSLLVSPQYGDDAKPIKASGWINAHFDVSKLPVEAYVNCIEE